MKQTKPKIKQQLYKKLNYKQPYENTINISLIFTYLELIEILNSVENKTKFFYLDNKSLYDILYQEDKVIQIEKKKYEYSFIYYLSLLIKEKENTTNFNFEIEFIKKIDENDNQENELQKLFVSKIILDLIYNYEGTKEKKDEDLAKIKERNKKNIKENIKLFNNYNLNLENIEKLSIDKLYLCIIIELIKNKKLENYDFEYDILSKLNLENIDINKNMLEELKNILDDEKYIKDYKMNEIQDFFAEKKVNFYYILIKYIFKNSFFIYNIPLLFNTRNTIINVIKVKGKELLSYFKKVNIDLLKRIYYNIRIILDSNYYHNLFLDLIFDDILEETIKNENGNWEEYMKYLITMEKNNGKIALFNYIYHLDKKDMNKTQIKFEEIVKIYKQLVRMIQNKKLEGIRKDDILLLSKYFIDNKNKDSLLKLFGQDSYDFFINESIKLNEKEKIDKRNKLKQILEYYKTFFFDSKKKDISSIEYAISEEGDLDYKIYEPDFEKAKILNDRMPLINYLFRIKDNNKAESEIQQIIGEFNNLEKLIKKKELMKDMNIENETISKLINYFNDKNNENYLIKIFGMENYEYVLYCDKENTENNTEKNEMIKLDELYKNNEKEKYFRNKYQIITEKEDSNELTTTSIFHTIDSKSLTNNSEQKKICKEEKLANHILKKSKVILNTKKEKGKLVFIFENISYGEYNISINNEKLLDIKKYFINNKIESIIVKSYLKYMEFLDDFKNKIYKKFIHEYKLKIDLEFQKIDEIGPVFNISCNYKFYSPNFDILNFKEENILLNKVDSKTQNFKFLLNEINDKKFERIKFQESSQKEINYISDNSFEKTKSINLTDMSMTKRETDLDFKKEAQIYQIVKIIGIIGDPKYIAEFIIELSNGFYIIGGADNILYAYDNNFKLLEKIKEIEDRIYSCFESEKSYKKENNIELIVCCSKKLYQIILFFKEEISNETYSYEYPNLGLKSCLQMNENNFVFIGNISAYLKDLLNSKTSILKINNFKELKRKKCLNSIKLNHNTIAITSNKVYYGDDKLIFYNIEKNKISREFEGNYSFTTGANGLTLMPREKIKDKNQILLCACTKYIDNQKNGIYLANTQMKEIQDPFYDTGNFEVFCFCPILIINPDNDILERGKEKIIKYTDYFFVGGFNLDKREGEIKLFKAIYDEDISKNKIEFVQDIELERNINFTGFEGAITCITQTKIENNGNILVTCYNGKIYLLNKPNLVYYLENKNKSN